MSELQKRNYQRELDEVLAGISSAGGDKVPRLLLHSCCGPCSSYCIEYLSEYFEITVLYYNPNIFPPEEFDVRAAEQERFIAEFPAKHKVTFIRDEYDPEEFYKIARGLEDVPEGGERCHRCYRLRLERAARAAKAGGYDYFATTLSISPLKNAQKINEIGEELSEIYEVKHLPSDFKKRDGYKRSTELSAQYDMYRQNYCGCEFSINK